MRSFKQSAVMVEHKSFLTNWSDKCALSTLAAVAAGISSVTCVTICKNPLPHLFQNFMSGKG